MFRYFKYLFFIVTIVSFIAIGVLVGFLFGSIYKLEGVTSLDNYEAFNGSKIYDIKNKVIGEFYKEKRYNLNYQQIPPNLIKAFISIEDKKFFSHFGIDFPRLFKANLENLKALTFKQGGSTITIQLCKQLFLTPEKSISRKIKEFWYALQLEKQYSKQEILTFYLNKIYFGHGCYGASIASEILFKKKLKEINVFEAAILASVINSPAYYSPILNLTKSRQRQELVLNYMVQNNYLSQEKITANINSFWNDYTFKIKTTKYHASSSTINLTPYFNEYIRQKLLRDGFNRKHIFSKGLKIYTTLDYNQQKIGNELINERIALKEKLITFQQQKVFRKMKNNFLPTLLNLEEIFNLNLKINKKKIREYFSKKMIDKAEVLNTFGVMTGNKIANYEAKKLIHLKQKSFQSQRLEGALVSVNPENGYVTAMIGGRDFNYHNQRNRAVTMQRQIGSLLKPFIYSLAMEEKKIFPSKIMLDGPKVFFLNDVAYSPKNYSGKYRGNVNIRDALRKSINTIAVDVLTQLDLKKTRDRLGQIFAVSSKKELNRKFPKSYSLALGTGSFSPLAMTTAYAILANDGRRVIPQTIRYITDNEGKVLRKYRTKSYQQLMDKESVFLTRNILQQVFIAGGTAFLPSLLKDFSHIKYSFGKTGTTSDWRDSWFVGGNKHLVTTVWFGYDNNQSMGKGMTGGMMTAPVWIQYQKKILQHLDVIPFKKTSKIITKKICRNSGLLEGDFCEYSTLYYEYFQQGNVPDEKCQYEETKKSATKSFLEALDDDQSENQFEGF